MAFDVIIAGQVISLPSVDEDPNWAQGLVEFMQQVALALSSTIGTFDVVPQIYNMVSNTNTGVDIPSLSFSSAEVRSAIVTYSIFRSTDTNNEAETGILELIFNEDAATNSKWEMSRVFTGSSTVQFFVNDAGQISFSSDALVGSNYAGNIVFKASVLQQNY